MKNKSKGQIIVEFVLFSGLFLIFLMGILDYGLYMYAKFNFDNSVRNAVRVGVKLTTWSTNQTDNTTQLKTIIADDCAKLPASLRTNLTNYVTITIAPNVNSIESITVAIVNYPYTSITGFADEFIPNTMSSSACMRYVNY